MLKLKKIDDVERNGEPEYAEFSIADKCVLNAVRVDNKNDVCWIFRWLINNEGRIYGTWQVIDHRNKKTLMRVDNSHVKLWSLLDLAMEDNDHTDEYGRELPLYLYGELLGSDKGYNNHDFSNDFVCGKIAEYPDYHHDMSPELSREQYADYVEGVKSRYRAAVISPEWYLTNEELERQAAVIGENTVDQGN